MLFHFPDVQTYRLYCRTPIALRSGELLSTTTSPLFTDMLLRYVTTVTQTTPPLIVNRSRVLLYGHNQSHGYVRLFHFLFKRFKGKNIFF